MLRCTLNVFPTTNVLNGSTLSIYSTSKATKCRGEKINFRDQEPQCERTALCFLPVPLTKGGLLNHFQSQGTAEPRESTLGSTRNKARVSRKGRLRTARCILGLVSTVTHVHPTQPPPGLRVPECCDTAFPLHTPRKEPDPKGNP